MVVGVDRHELRQIIAGLSEGVILVEPDQTIAYANAAALAMLQRSDPVPAPPPLVADEGLSFSVPVVFRARH